MKYTIKAHPTKYNGVKFRSRLEARWAAFFDLCLWDWEYEPIDLDGWVPDFRVTFPCSHSECSGSHSLLVEIKPYYSISEFQGHPCTRYAFGFCDDGPTRIEIPADASASFGVNPSVTEFEMCHGHGGGIYDISGWVDGARELWKTAGNKVQWLPK